MKIELLREIDLGDFGEITVRVGDINGDGKPELVFPQGIDGPDPSPSTGFYPHEKTIHCITAVDLSGDVVWQRGHPMGADFRKYHGAGPVLVHDINGDGVCEIVYVTAESYNNCVLRVLRGSDGEILRERRTWACWDIIPANLRGLGKRDFLLGDGLWLVFAYGEDLDPLWKWHRIYGGGHHHCAADVDGKGVDDLFIGVGRYNAQGERIWWRPDLDDVLEQMRCCPHMDKVEVRRLFADRKEHQVIWIGGRDVACVTAEDGELLWRLSGNHLHNYAIGRFDPDSQDELVYAAEAHKNRGSYMVRADGTVLWKADLGPGNARTVRNAGAHGSDLLLVARPSAGRRPYLTDVRQEILAELDMLPAARDYPDRDDAGPDAGRTYCFQACDIDGDGVDEILAFNRERMLLLKVDT